MALIHIRTDYRELKNMNGHKELTVAHKHSEVEWVEVEEVYTYTLFL